MLWITLNDLVALDVFKIIHKDLLGEHVDESLDISSHHVLIVSLLQLAEVAVWEGGHEELHVELISKVY